MLHFFPLLLYIAEVVISLPVSNAWPERGASVVKNVKTSLRSRLKNEMLQAILNVGINGPEVQKCRPIVKDAVSAWLQAKERRKLPKVPKNPNSRPVVTVQCETKEVGVQCEKEEGQNATMKEEHGQSEEDSKEFDVILEVLSLPKDREEGDSDSDNDSDSAFGSDGEDFDF